MGKSLSGYPKPKKPPNAGKDAAQRRASFENAATMSGASPIYQDMFGETLVGSRSEDGKRRSYAIRDIIGEGGQCMVFSAEADDGSRVAVKIVNADGSDPEELAKLNGRLEVEARTLERTGSDRIVNLIDRGERDGRKFIVLEYVEGKSLEEVIKEGKGGLPLERALAILSQVCAAIQPVHDRGIIHRDLKPANILITLVDGEERVTVLDFGLAKVPKDMTPDMEELDEPHSVIGTAGYIPPEQLHGNADWRADIYAVGAIAYRMLTGVAPFIGHTTVALIAAPLREKPPPFCKITGRNDIPPRLEGAVRSALQKDPAARFQRMDEMARVFAEFLQQPKTPGLAN